LEEEIDLIHAKYASLVVSFAQGMTNRVIAIPVSKLDGAKWWTRKSTNEL